MDNILNNSWAPLLIPALPMFAFLIIFCVNLLTKTKLVAYLSIFAILMSFALVIFEFSKFISDGESYLSLTWMAVGQFSFQIGYMLDALSLMMLLLVTSVSTLVQIYSIEYMKGEERFGWYYAAQSIFAASMILVVLTDSLLLLYIGWELVGLSSYLLIGFWYEKRSAAEAAKKAFITTRFGDVGLLIGIILIYLNTGTFQIHDVLQSISGIADSTVTIIAALLFIGAMGKSAQVPFHIWLPDAMEGPTPASALIHAATMVAAGVFLVARLFEIFVVAESIMWMIVIVGGVTSILAGLMALAETDFKRILAYSTVSQLGLMILALGSSGLGDPEHSLGATSGVFHLLTHGYFKALLFLTAGVTLHSLHKSSATIYEVRGLGRKSPVTAGFLIIGSLSLMGIPPLSGFFSKELILSAPLAIEGIKGMGVFGVALLACFLSSLYMTRLILVVVQSSLSNEEVESHTPPFVMNLPLLILSTISIGGGYLLAGPLDIVNFLNSSQHFHMDYVLATISTVVSVGGFAIGFILYNQKTVVPNEVLKYLKPLVFLIENRFFFDKVADIFVRNVSLATANFVAKFDRKVINDIFVDKIGMSPNITGEILRTVQTGNINQYITMFSVSVLVLIALSMWV